MSAVNVIEMTWSEYYKYHSDDGKPSLLIVDTCHLRFMACYNELLFAINRDDKSYYGPDPQITKEKFLDLVQTKYPDCFEWLLFHADEWL